MLLAPYSIHEGRILVVTPERHVARLIEANLERKRWEVACCAYSEDALRLIHVQESAATGRFDRIVLEGTEINLGAYEVLARIRGISVVWVAVMLAREEQVSLWKSFEHQPDAYLVKPFNPTVLLP